MNRIDSCFQALRTQGRAALVPFVTAGDPAPNWTVPVMHALVEAGADLIELGVPFSDPMADGPVIQKASERAIGKGVSLREIVDRVGEFRQVNKATPVVLMGYLNPVERYGCEAFARDAAAAGVDGVLMVDGPPAEMGALAASLERHDLYAIRLVAPTTTVERMVTLVRHARGYLYYVSFKGITGADRLDQRGLAAPIKALRGHTSLPLAVGFGIKTPDTAARVAEFADAVVIGSALVQALADATSCAEAEQTARAFLAPVRRAMDNNRP